MSRLIYISLSLSFFCLRKTLMSILGRLVTHTKKKSHTQSYTLPDTYTHPRICCLYTFVDTPCTYACTCMCTCAHTHTHTHTHRETHTHTQTDRVPRML